MQIGRRPIEQPELRVLIDHRLRHLQALLQHADAARREEIEAELQELDEAIERGIEHWSEERAHRLLTALDAQT